MDAPPEVRWGRDRPRFDTELVRFLARIDRETPPELALHLVVDNYSTHKSPPVKRWLKRHPRFHLHFIHTSSWLNMVEAQFKTLKYRPDFPARFRSLEDSEGFCQRFVPLVQH